MKLLMLFNSAYNGDKIYSLSSSGEIAHMIRDITPTEIFVCTGPSQYTSCRRNIALASGWSYDRPMAVYGFNLLSHFVKQKNCFLAHGKLIWIKTGEDCKVVNTNNDFLNLQSYIGNISINGSAVYDASLQNVWNSLHQLKHELKQEYYDEFKI